LKQCNHPSIIKYVDHSEEEMSIITEYADEGDLENYIKKKNG
jgi:serine/threonine protein kinase